MCLETGPSRTQTGRKGPPARDNPRWYHVAGIQFVAVMVKRTAPCESCSGASGCGFVAAINHHACGLDYSLNPKGRIRSECLRFLSAQSAAVMVRVLRPEFVALQRPAQAG